MHAGESFIFLDAAYAPRRLLSLPAIQKPGMVCARIDRPGTVVLMPTTAQTENLSELAIQDIQSDTQLQIQCPFLTTARLNHRLLPVDGRVLEVIPENTAVLAVAESDDWYQVDWSGRLGWISADYVRTESNCEL